jgi:hypothetical protein
MGINFSKEGAITEFTGEYEDFARWKTSIECALQGTGFDRILTDEKFSRANPDMSSTAFAQLSLAVIRGSANHVLEEVETTKDGYAAWQALNAWYGESDPIAHFHTYNRILDGVLEPTQERKPKRKAQRSTWPQRRKNGDSDSGDSSPNKRQRELRRLPTNVPLSPGDRISIPKHAWGGASAEDKTFIQDWNSRVKHKERTDDLVVPTGSTLTFIVPFETERIH